MGITGRESDNDDDDDPAAEVEDYQSNLCTTVLQDVSLQYPIVSATLNVCELVHKDKLRTLSVDEMKRICTDLEVDLSDVSTNRRKQPFLERLVQVVQECSCANSLDKC